MFLHLFSRTCPVCPQKPKKILHLVSSKCPKCKYKRTKWAKIELRNQNVSYTKKMWSIILIVKVVCPTTDIIFQIFHMHSWLMKPSYSFQHFKSFCLFYHNLLFWPRIVADFKCGWSFTMEENAIEFLTKCQWNSGMTL